MMIIVIIFILLACTLGWLYGHWWRWSRYWSERGVPHLPPHPVLGSLTFFFKQNTTTWLRYIHDHFKSPYVGIWFFWRPGLVVNCPELAQRILVADFSVFRDRFQNTKNTSDTIGCLQMFTVKDPVWSSIRRSLTPIFTPSKLKIIQNITSLKANELVQRIQVEIENKKFLDLRSVYTDYTTDVISIATLGVNSNATLTGKSPFRDITKEMGKFDWHRFLAWCSIFFVPELTGIFRFTFYPKHATDYFRRIFKTVEAQRQPRLKEVAENKDLLHVLMKMKQDSVNNGNYGSEDLMVAQAFAFLQGGFDTSALILTFASYELALASSVQRMLYMELKNSQININKNDALHTKDLSELPYLNATIKETLRKYATVGFIERIALNSYKIDENLTIPAGTPILVNGIGMQFNPKYYPNPEKFDPERFLPENEKNLIPFTFLPFGEGPRHCFGIRFAYQKMRHALAAIVLNYELLPLPDSPKPSDIELNKTHLFLVPQNKLSVKFVPRRTRVDL